MARSIRYLAIVTGVGIGLGTFGLSPAAQSTAPPPQQQQPQQQPPVFRAATNFVLVDAYPTKDGRIVEGLTAKDFQVFEDGKAQAIDMFEFVRIEPNTAVGARRDPNTQDEGNRLAADPRTRVFVIYLDHYHGTLSGSYSVRQPIVTMLNRLLTTTDLFGVATPRMKPRELMLGRQTETIEDQLQRNWSWGLQDGVGNLEEGEEGLVRCFGEKLALLVTARTREERTLESLIGFVRHLGALREARKVLMVFTRGWDLFEPDQAAINGIVSGENAGYPRIGIGPGGLISTRQPNNPGMADWAWCTSELSRAFQLDNRRKFRELLAEANRHNVAFYPVNVNGLSASGKEQMFLELAENTDGLAVLTNDFNAGLRKIADDVSAYYLLGYYSSNAKSDGSFRKIDVKMAPSAPGTRVKARRGYSAPVATPARATATSTESAKPATPEGVTNALDVLARLRPAAELFSYAVAGPADLTVVVELPSSPGPTPQWDKGAEVQFNPADGSGAAPVTVRMEAGARSVMATLPRPAGPGPYRFSVRVAGSGEVVTDRFDITIRENKILGEPLTFRAAPSPQAVLRPVANYQFWRTERVVIEWPLLAGAALERREARLLGRDGRPLAVPVNLTERERNGRSTIAAALSLAPLAPGDYVVELVVVAGGEEIRRYVPLRVSR